MQVEFGDKKLPERFWKKVIIKDCGYSSPCWHWTGSLNNNGYASFRIKPHKTSGHRAVYLQMVGEIKEGLVIDHMCRNRACMNPTHLQAVTQKQNLSTAIGLGEKGMVYLAKINEIHKAKTHCPQGHKYTDANTYWEERGTFKSRHCKTCRDANVRKLRERGYFKSYKRPQREANK